MKGEPSVLSPASFATLGELIRYLRERTHLTQRELAAQVNYHYSTISRIEKNNHIPDVPTLMGRFVPALDLDDKPEWISRLQELASAEKRIPLDLAPAALAEVIRRLNGGFVIGHFGGLLVPADGDLRDLVAALECPLFLMR